MLFFFCNRPALSSDKALGFTTQSLHQCCRAKYSHPTYRVTRKQTWICACREYQCMVVQWVLPRRSNPKTSSVDNCVTGN